LFASHTKVRTWRIEGAKYSNGSIRHAEPLASFEQLRNGVQEVVEPSRFADDEVLWPIVVLALVDMMHFPPSRKRTPEREHRDDYVLSAAVRVDVSGRRACPSHVIRLDWIVGGVDDRKSARGHRLAVHAAQLT